MNKYKFSFNVFTGNFDLVLSQIDIINVIGGTPLTVAGFDAAGVFESIPGWGISPTTGGLTQILSETPANPGSGSTDFINRIQADIIPTANLTNLNLVGLSLTNNLQGPNDFSGFQGIINTVNTSNTGAKDGISLLNNQLQLGDVTNPGTSNGATVIANDIEINSGMVLSGSARAINNSITAQSGSSAQSISAISNSITLQEQITGNVQSQNDDINVNVNQPVGVGINYHNYGGNVSGTLQYINGINFGPQIQSGGSVTNSTQAYLDNAHIFSGASLLGGYTSYGSSVNIDSGATFTGGGLTSFSANPNVGADLSTTGYNGFSTGGQFSNTMQFFNGHGSFSSFNSGSSVTNGINAFTDNQNMQSGSSVDFYTSLGVFPNFHAGSAITGQFQGLNVNAGIDITVPQITLAQLNVTGSGTTPQLTGIQINLNGFSSTAQKQGININDGNINVSANYDTAILPPSPGFLSMNALGGLYHVSAGFPVTNTLLLANDFGVSFEFEDDMGPDAFFGILGAVNVGFLNQLAVAAGKTVDTVTELLIAASVPGIAATGGTVTNANMITAAGVVNGGGTINVTNLRGLWIPPIFNSFSASNAWGVIVEDITSDNWFAKNILVDGVTGKPTNASIGIELQGTTKAFRNAVLTTTEENALTPLAGMQVFNSTTGSLDFYDGTTWNPLGPSAFSNTFLSNLTSPTAINQDLLPGADATLLLGNGSKRWSNLATVTISSSGNTAIDINARRLIYSDGVTPVVSWITGVMRDTSSNQSLDWFGRNLRDSGGSQSLDWDNRQLISSLGGVVLDYNLNVVNVNTHKVTNVVDPTAAQDAATKNYVDTSALLKANNLSDVASKPTSFNNISPMTTGGDIIYGGASGAGTRLANGLAGQVLTSAGGTAAPSWTTPGGGGGGSTTYKAIFTSSGTWTVPVTVTATTIVKITSVGAGGGGATGSSGGLGGGGGGQAGSTCIQWIDGTTLGATVAITVGVGGAPGVGSSSNGVNGGNTVFGAFHTAGGGVGGAGNSGTTGGNGGSGGVATGGDININGGGGQSGGGGIAATLGGVGGVGGSSSLGGGGGVSNSGTSFNGVMGGGGGGNGGGAGDGGAGGTGIVILEWIG